MKKKSCYKCNRPASSKEHVPPLCLFPEEKDIKTSLFRKNLITVPSCDLHNSKKSTEDQFLMASLAGIVGNNAIGYFHAKTKVKRTILYKGVGFLDSLMKEAKHTSIKINGRDFPVLVGKADFKRLNNCFEHIAYGLFYYEFKKSFDGDCVVLEDFLTYEDSNLEQHKLLCRKRFALESNKPKPKGENPDIFNYSFLSPDEQGLIALKMTFYGGATVFAAFKPKNWKSNNLIEEILKLGIKTFISFEDGSKFEFN